MGLTRVEQRSAGFGETLQAATDGECWALESLAAETLPKLTAFAKARGAKDAEGLAGAALMEFFGNLDRLRFGVPNQMWAYLYRIVRSRVVDEFRAHKPVELREQHSIEALVPEVAGFDNAVVDRELVDGLLDGLTVAQREILEMRFLLDLSIEETAARTGKTQTAVKGLQRRAIRYLSTLAAALVVIALGAVMWAVSDGDNPDGTTIATPVAGESSSEDLEPPSVDDVATVDESSAPSVSIVEAPDLEADAGLSEFRFIDAVGNATEFECKLDTNDFSPCASPKVYPNLDSGNHIFLVRAAGPGDELQAPALHVWTIVGLADESEDVLTGDAAISQSSGLAGTFDSNGSPISEEEPIPGAAEELAKEELRASSVTYKCFRISGTYSELEAKGYDVTIGANGDNTIDVSEGTRPDFVVTYGGNDSIVTGSGNDVVCSGTGNDSVSSGGGDDRVAVSGGNDTVDLGHGKDSGYGGNGNDSLIGGADDDNLSGGNGTDVLDGADGNDNLDGGGGLDSLIGGAGEDECTSGLDGEFGDSGCEIEPVPSP